MRLIFALVAVSVGIFMCGCNSGPEPEAADEAAAQKAQSKFESAEQGPNSASGSNSAAVGDQ